MHIRSRHLVIFFLIIVAVVFIVGFFRDTAEAPDSSVGDQSASVLFATQEDVYAVDRTHTETIRGERATFIEKVRRSLPSDVSVATDSTEEVSVVEEEVSEMVAQDGEETSPTDTPVLFDEHVQTLTSPIPEPLLSSTTSSSEVPLPPQVHNIGTQTPYGNADF